MEIELNKGQNEQLKLKKGYGKLLGIISKGESK